MSEGFGTRSMIYVKDEKGLFTADPKKDRPARFIPKISVAELEAMDSEDVVVERAVLELMKTWRKIPPARKTLHEKRAVD